ncbi:MAG TPA: SBBP repeat-containing protein [Patescibacteria group bacterium]|nr:SBBP repeat-containing protein [Patescibacteria group bacterium]
MKYWCFLFTVVMFFMLITNKMYGQNAEFEWVKVLGYTGESRINSITTDADGNVYATGVFTGKFDFDPGTGEYYLESVPHENGTDYGDIFIAKYSANGIFAWAKRIGAEVSDIGYTIATDNDGNVVISGAFCRVVDFDPGPDEFKLKVTGDTIAGIYDIFVCKLDSSGNFLWAKNMGGRDSDISLSVVTDKFGNIYTTGFFIAEADFDPGNDTFSLVSPFIPFVEPDIFVSKLDPNGNFVWAKRMGGMYKNWGTSIAVDDFQNVYTIGRFDSTADFNPGPGEFSMTSNGSEDIFITKLDSSGDFVWAKQIGGPLVDQGNGLAIDTEGNLIVIGNIQGEVDLDPNENITVYNAGKNPNVFIEKLTPTGELLWVKVIKGISLGNSLALDAKGDVYATGLFADKVDFDPGQNDYFLESVRINQFGDSTSLNSDVFISKLSKHGEFIWAKSIGSSNSDRGNAISVDGNGNILTAGLVYGYADFYPGDDTLILKNNYYGLFLHKMSQMNFFPAPTQLTIQSDDDGYAVLRWKDNSAIEDGFVIERNIGNGQWAVLDSVAANISLYTDTSVISGADIFALYRTYAFSGTEQSGYSNTAGISIALGIATFPEQQYLRASPNPARDFIIIESPINSSRNITAELYSIEGNLLKEVSLMPQPKLHINLSDQPQGTYLVKLTSGTESFVTKVNVVR